MSSVADTLLDELVSRPKAPPPTPARGTGSFSEFNVPPEVQRGRDDERVKILQGELAQETDPNLRRDIQLEIDRTVGGTAYNKSRAASAAPAADAPPPAAKSVFGDVLGDLVGGTGAKPAARIKQQAAAEPGYFDRLGEQAKAAIPGTVAEAGKLALDTITGKPILEAGTQMASGLGHAIMGGWRGLLALASGAGLDEAVRQVQAPELAGGARAETFQPETPMGQLGATVAAAPGELIAYTGKKAGSAAMEAGAGPGTAAAVETAVNAVPLVLGLRNARAPIGAQPKLVGSGSIADEARGAPPAAIQDASANLDIPTYLRQRMAQPEPAAQAAEAAPARGPKQELTLAPAEPRKPTGPSVFDQPEVTPTQAAAAAAERAPKFEEAPSPIERTAAAPKPEQAARAKVLQEIGLVGQNEVRKSAIEGNPAKARTDFDASRLEGPVGDTMRAVLDNERSKLTQYADRIVADTGGTAGTDTSALYGRGNTIAKPFQDLKTYFDENAKALYAEADKRAPGVQTPLERAKAILSDESEFLGTTEGEALLKGVRARAKALEIADKDGNIVGGTAKQAERLRQYLGDQWTPRTSRLIGRLKDALDDDVTSAAGGDVYAKARAARAMRSAIFENDILDPNGRVIPNGVGKLFDASGKALEATKATEAIPDAVARLPVDELAQVVKTLRSAPKEIQPQAQAALAEIKAQFANRIAEAGTKPEGQWGAPGVTKYLQANRARLGLLFDQAELARIQNLNDAGHILRIGPYPGAAVQGSNLVRSGVARGIEASAQGAGALLGTVAAGPLGTAAGAAIGGMIGRSAAGKASAAMDARAVKGRLTTLGEIAKGP